MSKRSKVKLFAQIRRVREREGASIHELSRRFNVHRRDVRLALASPVPPPRKATTRAAPVLDRWKPTIDAWLTEDRTAPRKQRHTARRVWQRLVEEHGAQIGESTVRAYVAEVRGRFDVALVEVMVPQRHVLGDEGEVDFGMINVYLAGVFMTLPMFVMRLSASGRGFERAYLNEAQEVFLDGHVRAFDYFGGVPTRIRYDNLKSAVQKVLKGRDRIESERFIALRSHYGFDSFFCQPGIKGSHEKGGVEGEVGRFRRRHLVPVPKVASMTELNELLAAGAAKDDARFIAQRHITVAEHFALEAAMLRPLPAEAFDVTAVASHRVDRKSRVSVRGCLYSVPARFVGRRVDVRVGPETIEVLNGANVVARHTRGLKGEEILALDHYLEVLTIKPGALPGATALARARAAGVFGPTHERFWETARRRLGDRDGTRALLEVLLLHRALPAAAVITGIEHALNVESLDPAVVAIEARRTIEPATAVIVPIGEGLHRFDRPPPTTTIYDDLLEAQ
jgi:transposase